MNKANEYLEKHRIMELFSDMAASLAFHKPNNVRSFLIQELTLREREGSERGLFLLFVCASLFCFGVGC